MVLRVYQHDSWGLWGWSREGARLTPRGHERGPGGVKHPERPGLCPGPCLGETCLLGTGWMPTSDLWTGVPHAGGREREAPRLKPRSFRFVVLYCAPEARRGMKKIPSLVHTSFLWLERTVFLFTITVHSKAVQAVREMYLQRALTEEAVRDKETFINREAKGKQCLKEGVTNWFKCC